MTRKKRGKNVDPMLNLDYRYGDKYTLKKGILNCYFCGDHRNRFAYIPNLELCQKLGSDYFLDKGIILIKVPSCRECRRILDKKEVHLLESAVKIVYDEVYNSYKEHLASATWEDDEVSELGYSLRNYIKKYQIIGKWANRRLEYMEDIHYKIV